MKKSSEKRGQSSVKERLFAIIARGTGWERDNSLTGLCMCSCAAHIGIAVSLFCSSVLDFFPQAAHMHFFPL